MKFVGFKTDSGSDAVAFINPNRVMTVEASSRNAKTSKLFFGGSNFLVVVGRPEDVAADLAEGLGSAK